jgi:3-deoxy-manno-octulosonate cytidylyltransferase (CMP-KDO synthetase)
VPLRLKSQRLPEKIFADVAGKPLCVRALDQVQKALGLCRTTHAWQTIAAVDDARTETLLRRYFPELPVVVTDPALPSGTDRVHAAVSSLGTARADSLVVNVQGDMPRMSPKHTAEFLDWCVEKKPAFASLAHAWPRDQDLEDRAHVKALVSHQGRAIYFSRFPVPYSRLEASHGDALVPWFHVGIYAYSYETLAKFCAWAPSPLEKHEGLEQLRALDRGVSIDMMTFENTDSAHSFRGVDTPADLEWARGAHK